MKVMIIFLLFILNISGVLAQDFEFDFELIRDWTKESKHLKTPPYIYENKKEETSIRYIAVEHTANLNDPTYTLIEKSIKEYKPQVVIIEGVPSSLGLSNSNIAKSAEDCFVKSNKELFVCGEAMFTAQLANKNSIQFVGGEPDVQAEIKELTGQSYSYEDIYFFYVARNLYGEKRSGGLSQESLENSYYQSLSRYTDPSSEQFNFENFKKWFAKELEKELSISNLENQDYAPFNSGHRLNKIAYAIDTVREKNILETIEKSLNQYKRVLVVYGASHLYKHQLVLDDAFQKKEKPLEDIHINNSRLNEEKLNNSSSPISNESSSKVVPQ